jgi:polar amino acid transport system substrate-binding protein
MMRIFLAFLLTMILLKPVYAFDTIIYAANFPPYQIEEGPQRGFAIEILKEAERRIGRTSHIKFGPWVRSLKMATISDNVILPAIYRTPSREKDFKWIVEYTTSKTVFLTIDNPINSLNQARHLDRIGVTHKSSMDDFLTAQGFINLDRVDYTRTNILKLMAGRIDAWCLSENLARWAWREAGFSSEMLVTGKAIKTTHAWIAAGPMFPDDLAVRYRNVVKKMKADGTIEKILNRYR